MADRSWLDALGPALERWRAAGIITPAQADAIRELEHAAPEEPPTAPERFRLDPATLVIYLGAFLVAVASIAFVALDWDDMGRTQQFVWGTLAVVVPWGLAYVLRRTGHAQAIQGSAGLILLGNLGLLLFVYTFFRLVGWWPDRPYAREDADMARTLTMVNLAISAAVAAVIAFRLRLPFMLFLG